MPLTACRLAATVFWSNASGVGRRSLAAACAAVRRNASGNFRERIEVAAIVQEVGTARYRPQRRRMLRDNLDENGSGNRSLKRRPGSGGMIRSIIEVRKPFLLPLFDCR
jgi:hypothetical protein